MSIINAIRTKLNTKTPDGKATPDDMMAINRYLSRPFDPAGIFVFPAVMATDALTTHFTHVGASSRRNFGSDADRGVPFNLMHETLFRSYGYTYAGYNDTEAGEARAAVYVPRGRLIAQDAPNSNHLITDIEQGLLREVSVAMGGALRFVCDVCGRDVFDFECPHIPGLAYNEAGARATATAEDARLEHLSGVDRGACPGAVIGSVNTDLGIPVTYRSEGVDFSVPIRDKIGNLTRMSRITKQDSDSVLDLWKLTDPLRLYSVPPVPAGGTTPPQPAGGGGDAMERGKLAAALTAKGLTALGASLLQATSDEPEALAAALAAGFDTAVRDRGTADPLLGVLASAEIKTPEALHSVLHDAKQGREYRTRIVADAVKEATRAKACEGEQAQTAMRDSLSALPTDSVLAMTEHWRKMGDQAAGITTPAGGGTATGTRQTAPTNLPNAAVPETAGAKELAAKADDDKIRGIVSRLGPARGAAATQNGGGGDK